MVNQESVWVPRRVLATFIERVSIPQRASFPPGASSLIVRSKFWNCWLPDAPTRKLLLRSASGAHSKGARRQIDAQSRRAKPNQPLRSRHHAQSGDRKAKLLALGVLPPRKVMVVRPAIVEGIHGRRPRCRAGPGPSCPTSLPSPAHFSTPLPAADLGAEQNRTLSSIRR